MEAENRRAVLAATVAVALLIANQVAGKSVRDALFLSSFSVASLPPVMMASSLASVVAVILLSRAMQSASPFRVEPLAVGLATLLLGGLWLLSVGAPGRRPSPSTSTWPSSGPPSSPVSGPW